MPYKDPAVKAAYMREYWQRSQHKLNTRYKEQRTKLDQLKSERGCDRCGYSANPRALQFHHLDPTTKIAAVTRMIGKYVWETVLAEIEKCVLLCANCHAEEHTGLPG
jgi:hypothetical protein